MEVIVVRALHAVVRVDAPDGLLVLVPAGDAGEVLDVARAVLGTQELEDLAASLDLDGAPATPAPRDASDG